MCQVQLQVLEDPPHSPQRLRLQIKDIAASLVAL